MEVELEYITCELNSLYLITDSFFTLFYFLEMANMHQLFLTCEVLAW